MLQIKNLQITMKKDLRDLIKDFTFTLNKGDKCAVIGEEGNGKSTLLKWIYDAASVEDYAECRGEIGKNGLILGYLSQELTPQEKEKTVYEFCSGEPAFLDSTPGEIASCAGKLNLPPEMLYADRRLGSLSGGEKVKIRIALLLLKQPDILLLDEPSNDIDIETLEWMEGFIKSSTAPVLFISHDETLLENTANVIIHIEQLRRKTLPRHTVAKATYRQYVEERLSAFDHQQQLAGKEREEQKKQQERYRQIYQKVNHDLNTQTRQDPHGGRLLKKKMKAVKSLGRRFDREAENMTEFPDTEEAIMVKFDTGIQLPAGKTILDYHLEELRVSDGVLSRDITLYVRGAGHICIVGRNGAGKTTLLRQIAQALLERTDIKAAYMPQDYADRVNMELTPVEYLAADSTKQEMTKAKTYLGSMKYTADECEHSIKALSGGQKAKLFFLKMILDKNDVLVLDEPTRNFSPLSNPVIRQILKEYSGAIISVSHDRKYITEVCPTVYRLDETGLHKRD